MEKAKKRRFGIIATIILILAIVFGIVWAQNTVSHNQKHQDTLARVKKSGKIVWGVKADTKLFGLMDTKTGSSEGFDVDLAKAVTKQMSKQLDEKLTPSFVTVTTASKVQLLKNTNIDGVFGVMTITPERAKIVDFSQPYFPAGQSLLVKKDSGINSIQDLNDPSKTVLVVVGTTAAQNIKKFAPKAKTIALQDYASAMQAMKSGQGQAISTDNAILYGLASENPDYHVVGGTLTYGPYGAAFDHDQKPMVKQVDQALDTLKANGTYNQLIKKWFGQVPGLDLNELEVHK
ncbi:glutamine-binding protein [Fructobacillus pseudoficulneus]|uniref:Glutamine-binding protein n=1 Tax=Fructobacillus pseudoficulneus TaxID=220714 RepID=A0A3F3GUD3_9LACO|nr:transporter substrate-binding domain-containing protein [Fructobacillus pseudoficulneus]GAP03031.1 glutamine-binding protein [Fructobacillus pseudoficulneus]SEH41939.1 amino acid ABC transporter substrate-binding protein, PAAT family (TC 3.A.1.3.-) [Fructobacillus pseudoficulneus]